MADPAVLVALWRPLRGPAFVTALNRARWYVQENDEVGGWCVMPADVPPSSGVPQVASTMSYATAYNVAAEHNRALDEQVVDQVAAMVAAMTDDDRKYFLNWMAALTPQVLISAVDRWQRPHPSSADLDAAHAEAETYDREAPL
jgi:hypothetical protein